MLSLALARSGRAQLAAAAVRVRGVFAARARSFARSRDAVRPSVVASVAVPAKPRPSTGGRKRRSVVAEPAPVDDGTAILNALDRLDRVLVKMHMPDWWSVVPEWEGRDLRDLQFYLQVAGERDLLQKIQTAADAAGMTHEVLYALRMIRYGFDRTSLHRQRPFASAAEFKAAIVTAFSHVQHREAVAALTDAAEPLYRSVSSLPELEAESKRRNDRKVQELDEEDRAMAAARAAAQAAAAASAAAPARMA